MNCDINQERYIFMNTFNKSLENTINFIEKNNYNFNTINKAKKYKNKWENLIQNYLNVINNKDNLIYDDFIKNIMIKTKDLYLIIGKETTNKINNKEIIYNKDFINEYNLIMYSINSYFNLE